MIYSYIMLYIYIELLIFIGLSALSSPLLHQFVWKWLTKKCLAAMEWDNFGSWVFGNSLGFYWELIGNPLGIRWQFERVWALCASTSGAKAWRLQPGRVSMREWVSSLECLQHDAVRWQFVSNECNMIQTYSDPVILFFRQQDAGAWCKISIDK